MVILDHIQEVMLYVPGAENIDPNACLDDPKIIKDIVSKCGMKTQYVAPPKLAADMETSVSALRIKYSSWANNNNLRRTETCFLGHLPLRTI